MNEPLGGHDGEHGGHYVAPPTLAERIAVLENRHDTLDGRFDAFETKLDTLISESTKQRGMIGGAVMVATGIVTALSLFKDWIIAHLRP